MGLQDGFTTDFLIKRADSAMYQAKGVVSPENAVPGSKFVLVAKAW
jgi:hypothetical protein